VSHTLLSPAARYLWSVRSLLHHHATSVKNCTTGYKLPGPKRGATVGTARDGGSAGGSPPPCATRLLLPLLQRLKNLGWPMNDKPKTTCTRVYQVPTKSLPNLHQRTVAACAVPDLLCVCVRVCLFTMLAGPHPEGALELQHSSQAHLGQHQRQLQPPTASLVRVLPAACTKPMCCGHSTTTLPQHPGSAQQCGSVH
jgi:hypothetical protein